MSVLGGRFSILGSRLLVIGSWFLIPGSLVSLFGSRFSVLGSGFSFLHLPGTQRKNEEEFLNRLHDLDSLTVSNHYYWVGNTRQCYD